MRQRNSPIRGRDASAGREGGEAALTFFGGQFAPSSGGTGEETWNMMADNAATTSRKAMEQAEDVSSQLVKLRREIRDESGRTEQIARRIARAEIERRISEAQWVSDQRHEKLARSLEQQRLADGSQRAELWRDLQEIRNMVGEMRLKSPLKSGGSPALRANR